ncbi:MAG: peptidyl-prolyl cis-trans isomerase [Myxococcales bacterium]|nr:peptidyl-prolyl cis-trans isomerase [Myxococcales bacterium]
MSSSSYRALVTGAAAVLGGGLVLAVLSLSASEPARPNVANAQPAPTSAPAPAGSDVIVARVGSSVITLAELERALAEAPRATLAKLGSTPEEVRRNYLEQVLVRDALFAEEARARGMEKRKDIRDRTLAVLRSQLVEVLRKEKGSVTEEDIKAYYEANSKKFTAPKRIGVHRILVASEDDAKEILAELGGGAPDPKKWNEIAREKSLDKTTHLSGGNLGILNEDGSTSEDSHYDPGLYAAADKVKDGELVPTPVKEGSRFAVVWKRQTMRAMTRPIELEAPGIRAALVDQRIRQAMGELLGALRPDHLKELNPELCDMVTVTSQGDVEKAKRPGVLPRSKRVASPVPVEGPGGLR